MSLLNSGWPHPGERPTPLEPNPPVNPDSNPGQRPEEDPEEASAQDPEILHLGHPDLDTSQTPSWPGLRTLLQQLPPQDSDERYCLTLEEEELAELRLFCAWRRREALGQGVARLVPPKLEECTCEKERRSSAEVKTPTATCGSLRPSPGQPFSPLATTLVWKPRRRCLDPVRSRSVKLGTKRRHPKGKSRASWRLLLIPRRTLPAPPAPLPLNRNPKDFS